MKSSNKAMEFARTARPTRKGDAPLLAAQPQRWRSEHEEENIMRMRIVIGSLLLAACAMGIGRAADQREQSNFRIVVTFDGTKNEVSLKCTAGCAWTELKFDCGGKEQCSSAIDSSGTTD